MPVREVGFFLATPSACRSCCPVLRRPVAADGTGRLLRLLSRSAARPIRSPSSLCFLTPSPGLPVGEVTALNLLAPFYVTLGAAAVSGRAAGATADAAVGMALMARFRVSAAPASANVESPRIYAMLGARCALGVSYLLRQASDAESRAPSLWLVMLSCPPPFGLWEKKKDTVGALSLRAARAGSGRRPRNFVLLFAVALSRSRRGPLLHDGLRSARRRCR